ncbi:MAG TPA: phosphopantothenoylcysteine decarboxylase [Tepidisphaeraceae bacterium]|nr:phosphopantothenoylcysteine decarboxylase [Tepidisphaeraceae bacterium]
MQFLVTAGNTREMIDRVRDWGNVFTGNTGRAIAEALAGYGKVDLLTSNTRHADDLQASGAGGGISVTLFKSHADLRSLLAERVRSCVYDAIFMTAAVADYAPGGVYEVVERKLVKGGREQWVVQDVSAGKVKSHFTEIAVTGTRTEKLIDLFRNEWDFDGLLVKFKLEVGIAESKLIEVAEASRLASCADYIVANTLDMVTGEHAGAWLLGKGLKERISRAELPNRLARLVARQP